MSRTMPQPTDGVQWTGRSDCSIHQSARFDHPDRDFTGLTSTNITITEAATLPPPAAPTGVAAVAGTDGPVTISWDIVPGVFTYNVKRATTSGGPYTVIAPNTGGTGFLGHTSAIWSPITMW